MATKIAPDPMNVCYFLKTTRELATLPTFLTAGRGIVP